MKRIIAVMVVLMFATVLFNINVSADTVTDVNGGITSGGGGNGGTRTEYGDELSDFTEALEDYINGDITIDEFLLISNQITSNVDSAVADRMGLDYVTGITGIIEEAVEKYGDNAADYISQWIDDFFDDYRELAQIESPDNLDLKGGTCALKVYGIGINKGTYEIFYANCTGVVDTDAERYYLTDIFWRTYGKTSGDIITDGEYITDKGIPFSYSVELYGDWVYSDGTEAPTNDEYIDTEILDLSDTSDTDLEKLLEDLLNKLNLEMPDLSTLEGLLKSIYDRLGTLDSDDDGALLASINAAIISLAQDGQSQNLALISKLDELKEALNGGEASETDLSEITEELKTISSTLKGLAVIEVAENILELTDSEQKLFDEYADLIPLLVDKIGLAVVSQTMHDIETVIFTTSAPSDLNIILFGEEYTLLSTETFSNDEVMQSVSTIKTFISVILIYVWCIRMRRLLI